MTRDWDTAEAELNQATDAGGLLDHAQHLIHLGETEAAEAAIGEARGIATRLRCQPLLDRADTTQPATPHTAAS